MFLLWGLEERKQDFISQRWLLLPRSQLLLIFFDFFRLFHQYTSILIPMVSSSIHSDKMENTKSRVSVYMLFGLTLNLGLKLMEQSVAQGHQGFMWPVHFINVGGFSEVCHWRSYLVNKLVGSDFCVNMSYWRCMIYGFLIPNF